MSMAEGWPRINTVYFIQRWEIETMWRRERRRGDGVGGWVGGGIIGGKGATNPRMIDRR